MVIVGKNVGTVQPDIVFQDIDYGFDVMIAGPRGTPDGVIVTH